MKKLDDKCVNILQALSFGRKTKYFADLSKVTKPNQITGLENRLYEMQEAGLIKKVSEKNLGGYRITEFGKSIADVIGLEEPEVLVPCCGC